jgi:proteasome lid subunit RPN8/RPN11
LTLEISGKHVKQISSHSKESYPIEACGVLIGTLAGDVRAVTEVWPAKNQLSSESSYEIDPETLFRAFSHAEENKVEVVGFYHSHPFWSAEASEIDRARANYPGLSYLIYSIPRNEILSFYFDGKQLIHEPARMTSD